MATTNLFSMFCTISLSMIYRQKLPMPFATTYAPGVIATIEGKDSLSKSTFSGLVVILIILFQGSCVLLPPCLIDSVIFFWITFFDFTNPGIYDCLMLAVPLHAIGYTAPSSLFWRILWFWPGFHISFTSGKTSHKQLQT